MGFFNGAIRQYAKLRRQGIYGAIKKPWRLSLAHCKYTYLHQSSCHPRAVFTSILTGELTRISRCCRHRDAADLH
eukprot:9876171-Lingulodinium_polyedra.AAC.1